MKNCWNIIEINNVDLHRKVPKEDRNLVDKDEESFTLCFIAFGLLIYKWGHVEIF